MLSPAGIRVIDVLYRVSTRASEQEGESLFNQRREIEEDWAALNGIKVRRRIEVAESGQSSHDVFDGALHVGRRVEWPELIAEYETLSRAQRPDAVVIDWIDRWSRNVSEYAALLMALRVLGIRLLAVGDELDLTEPRNNLASRIRAAILREFLIKENGHSEGIRDA